ncbi:MAG TPA: HD domain-containing protein [Candidatus Krumholzibacteria bacterium]|nr:HD domain-containing protein [Candidatus Krumholzibacteria bacterium]
MTRKTDTTTSHGPDVMPAAGGTPLAEPSAERLHALQAFNARMVCMTIDESSYDEVVRGVGRVIGCDACALFLHDAATDELELKASVGYNDVEAGLRIALADHASVHAQAFREEYLVHTEDQHDEPGMRALTDEHAAVLVLPVISNKGPVGVFEFASRQPGGFSPQDIGLCGMAVDQMAYSLENMRLVGELSRSRDAVIRGMALLAEIRDPHIGGHLNRICAYSGYLASQLSGRMGYHEVTREFTEVIARAAALHDVGKVGIPDAILLKPGKLTEDEYAIMKTHTLTGSQLLRGLMQDFGEYALIAMGAEVAVSHHEWWDGTGYPHRLAGREIPLAARIVAIADVYDALTSRRVYKDAWSREETMDALRQKAGTQFDPDLVEVFLARPQELDAIRRRYPD